MIGGDVPDHDLDPPWVDKDLWEEWQDAHEERIEDEIDRDKERAL